MIEPRSTLKRFSLLLPLVLAIATPQFGCKGGVVAPSNYWFDLNFTLGNINRTAFDRVVVTIFQQQDSQYTYDVFHAVQGGSGLVRGSSSGATAGVVFRTEDVDNNQRRDLVFAFDTNPFATVGDTMILSVLHAPWGGKSDNGKPITPAFTVRIEGFKSNVLIGKGERIFSTSTLFTGPVDSQFNMPRFEIAIACEPNQQQACIGDGGPVTDVGLPDEYSVTDLKIEPATVSEGQTGAVLSFLLKNLSSTKDIQIINTSFTVDNQPPVNRGFAFTADPSNVTTLARQQEATLRYMVAFQSGPVEAPTPAAPGAHTVLVRVDAFEGTAPTDDGGSPVQGAKLDYFSAPPTTPVTIQRKAAASVVSVRGIYLQRLTTTGPDGGVVLPAETNEIYFGDTGTLTVTVRNDGEAPIRDLVLTPMVRLAATEDVPPGITLMRDPTDVVSDGDGGTVDTTMIAGNSTRDYRFIVSVATPTPTVMPPVGGIRLNWTITGKDGNSGVDIAPVTSADRPVTVKGRALVTATATSSTFTTVNLGQTGVVVKVTLQNNGTETAEVRNLKLFFQNRAGDDVTDAAWHITASPNPIITIGGGLSTEASFTYTIETENRGQVGENTVRAGYEFRTRDVSPATWTPVAASQTQSPWRLTVVFQPGPTLRPPLTEQQARYGASVAGIGLATFQTRNENVIGIGAPGATAGSGAVYFRQINLGAGGTLEIREPPKVGGLPNARLGEAITGIGNWDKSGPTDISNEIALGRPGLNNPRLYSIATASPILDTLPTAFVPCTDCDLGVAMTGNVLGVKGGTTKAQRRLFAVGAPKSSSNLGRVDVFFMRLPDFEGGDTTNVQYRRIDGDQSSERFGAALSVADVNGDGDLDVIVGSPGFGGACGGSPDAVAGRGRVRVLLAPDFVRFTQTWQYFCGETAGEAAGTAVAGIGDVDGDGKDDIAIGAPHFGSSRGKVYVISGATGQKIYEIAGTTWQTTGGDLGEEFGSSLAGFKPGGGIEGEGDFNNDQRPDFAVGAPKASPAGRAEAGAVYVHSGPKEGSNPGKLLLRFDGEVAGGHFGASVASVPDLNADSFQDLVVGAPDAFDASEVACQQGGAACIRRGAAFVFFGGAFDPFRAPTQIVVDRLDDGVPVLESKRVSVGQATTPLIVKLRNTGDTAATNVKVTLIIRDQATGMAIPVTQPGQTPVPNALATITIPTPHTTTLEKSATPTDFPFNVAVSSVAPTGKWVISATITADAGGVPEVDPEQRRVWTIERKGVLQVVAIETLDGEENLGIVSLNPGAPIRLAADVINTGDGIVTNLAGSLFELVGGNPQNPPSLTITQVSASPAELPAGQTGRVTFEVSTNPMTETAERRELRALVSAKDKNSGDNLQSDTGTTVTKILVTSLAKVTVKRVASSRRFLAPGGTGFPFESEIFYQGPTLQSGPFLLEDVEVGLRFNRGDQREWADTPDGNNVVSVAACTTNPCVATDLFRFSVGAPPSIAPGPVEVTGTFRGKDFEAGPPAGVPFVWVRGVSDPVTLPDSKTTIEILGLGTQIASVAPNPAVPGLAGADASFGTSVAPVGDLTNDGFNDIAVGSPTSDGLAGRLFILDGNQAVSGSTTALVIRSLSEGSDRMSYAQALAGGFDLNVLATTTVSTLDLVVGIPGFNLEPSSAAIQPLLIGATPPLPEFVPTAGNRDLDDKAGSAVDIGDANNDGCPDVIVGLPDALDMTNTGANPRLRTGGACIRFGTTPAKIGGTACSPGCTEFCWSPTRAGDTVKGAAGDRFGAAVAAWRRTDGRYRVAIGAPGADLGSSLRDVGQVYVYTQGITCTGYNAAELLVLREPGRIPTPHQAFGAALAGTRVIGEEFSEGLIIGAPGAPPAPTCTDQDASCVGGAANCPCPTDTMCPSDCAVDNCVCAAKGCDNDGQCSSGNACIQGICSRLRVGKAFLRTSDALLQIGQGERRTDRYASVVATAGDMDNDGAGDIAIGSPGARFGSTNSGRVSVLSGRSLLQLYQFGTAADTNIGRSLAGLGRVNADPFHDLAVGATGKVIVLSGLARPSGASLKVDLVTPQATTVDRGQKDVGVLLDVTNVGRSPAFAVKPTLVFRKAGDPTMTQAAESYTQTKVFQGSTEITDANPLIIQAGTKVQLLVRVNVNPTADLGLTVIDANITGRNNSADGEVISRSGADVTGEWTVSQPPDLVIEELRATETVVFQGQQSVPVTVKIRNNSATPPTSVTVALNIKDSAGMNATGNYTFVQVPVPAKVGLVSNRACTCAQGTACPNECNANETCESSICSIQNPFTVTVNVSVNANAVPGEHTITAQVTAPNMPAPVTGPAMGHVWTVLGGGVLDVSKICFADSLGLGCREDAVTLSAGQQNVKLLAEITNNGSLSLRELVPTLFYPVVLPEQPAGRPDLASPTVDANQPTEILAGTTATVMFNLSLSDIIEKFGKVFVDGSAVARDSNHSVADSGANTKAQFELQQKPDPSIVFPDAETRIQPLIFRGEKSVRLNIKVRNGAAGESTPRATWSDVTTTISFRNGTTTYSAQLRPQVLNDGSMADVTTPVVGEAKRAAMSQPERVLRFEFDLPDTAPLGATTAVITLSGKDENTNLAIPPRENSQITFTVTETNTAGNVLVSPSVEAPTGALRFGASLAAAKVSDARTGLVVVGAPESPGEGEEPMAGRVYVYGMSGTPAQLTQLTELKGLNQNDLFGQSVAILKDHTGIAKLIAVAAPGFDDVGLDDPGAVFLYSADAPYDLQHVIVGTVDSLRLGQLTAGGPISAATGTETLLVSVPAFNNGTTTGRVFAFSGQSPFAPLQNAPWPLNGKTNGGSFGAGIATHLVPNTGGTLTIFVGEPGVAGSPGRVYAVRNNDSFPDSLGNYSCDALQLPRDGSRGGRNNRFGSSVAVTADGDSDGCPDLYVGAPGQDMTPIVTPSSQGGSPSRSAALPGAGSVFAARSGSAYYSDSLEMRGFRLDGQFGATVIPVGNWDGDAGSEIAIAEPNAPVGGRDASNIASLTNSVGAVYVYSRDKDIAIFRAHGDRLGDSGMSRPADRNFGASLAAVDLTGDGIPELIVGAPGMTGAAGRIYVYRGGQRNAARLVMDTVSAAGRKKIAHGVAVTQFLPDDLSTAWRGMEVNVTITNQGKTAANEVKPTLEFRTDTGAAATGISVDSVTSCSGRGPCEVCTSNCSAAAADGVSIDSEAQRTWTFRINVGSVAPTGPIGVFANFTAIDGLTGRPINNNPSTAESDPNFQAESLTRNRNANPDFVEIVTRGDRLTASPLTGVATTGTRGFGSSVAWMDLNNDGFPELIVGERPDSGQGQVHVFSGQDVSRKLLTIAEGGTPTNTFGSSVAVGKVGTKFVIFVTHPGASRAVKAYPVNCSAGSCAIEDGRHLAGGSRDASSWDGPVVGNLSGDPVIGYLGLVALPASLGSVAGEFLAIGVRSFSEDAGTTTAVRLVTVDEFSGFAGGDVADVRFLNGVANQACANGVLAVRPTSGAGGARIAVACTHVTAGVPGAVVVNLADNSRLNFTGGTGTPTAVALLPDLDGLPGGEVLVGWAAHGANNGRLQLWSGGGSPTTPILQIDGSGGNMLGIGVAGLGDVDGDGTLDFAVGNKNRTVRVYSGKSTTAFPQTLTTVQDVTAGADFATFGEKVFSVGDINYDGFADFAIPAPGATVGGKIGAVRIYLGGHP